jgi:hypothetical protein
LSIASSDFRRQNAAAPRGVPSVGAFAARFAADRARAPLSCPGFCCDMDFRRFSRSGAAPDASACASL